MTSKAFSRNIGNIVASYPISILYLSHSERENEPLLEFAFMMADKFSQNMALVLASFMAWNKVIYINNFAYISTY